MKKKIVKVLLSVAVMTSMMFSISACGSKNNEVQDAGANVAEPASTQQEATDLIGLIDQEGPAESTIIDGREVSEVDTQESTTEELEETMEAAEIGETIILDERGVDGEDIIDIQEPTVEDAENPKEEKKESKVAKKEAMTLEKWIQSDECAEFSEMMNEGLDGMTISFEVNGDTISMIFTMTEAIDVVEGANEEMNEFFTSNAIIFEAIRDQLIDETGNGNIVLRLIYRNADGSNIFSRDF